MQHRLILFDIDGTLLASGGAGENALRLTIQERFGPEASMDGIEIAGRTDSSIAHQVLQRYGQAPTPEAVTDFLDAYVRKLTEMLPQTEGRLLPGILELLEALQGRPGVLLGLLTGNLRRGAELKLTQYKVWNYFNFGAYADDSHDRNLLGPFARQRALEQHGVEVPPELIFVLGDTPHDITCARALGAKAVAVATGRSSFEELQACAPDFLFHDFSDIAAVLRVLTA